MKYTSLGGMGEEESKDPMTAFKRAMDAISVRKDLSSGNASGDGTTAAGNKRRMTRRSDDTSPSQGCGLREGVSARFQRQSLTGCSFGGLSGVLADLSANVFTRMQAFYSDKDSPEVVQQVQGELLQVSRDYDSALRFFSLQYLFSYAGNLSFASSEEPIGRRECKPKRGNGTIAAAIQREKQARR